ncbi:D-lactate dehydrogenase (Cytochrome) [Rhodospirillaceae bacterium LM-1]|nr:D-lactate dehydrogenase (Cytochrome) [Rhodospirillaceae bacterium LM-1]
MTILPLVATLQQQIGPSHVLTGPADMAAYLHEERGTYESRALAVARPANAMEVAAVIATCAEAGVSIVPQGGNTGLVGGSVSRQDQIILSLGRLNRIRGVDPINKTLTVEAGCSLAQAQMAADDAGLLFPLSMASEGSCQIGGNLSTNAGGTAVLRYGNAKRFVLGLEVVLADGRIWDGLKSLRKDNTGYDLKQLFLGSEGTLGIITAATLALYAKPREIVTAFLGLDSPSAALTLLARLQEATGEQVTGFELMARRSLEFVTRHIPGARDPLSAAHPWYVLAEISTSRANAGFEELMETELAAAIGNGLVADGVVAASHAQRQQLWKLRESIPEAQKHEGGSLKHDICVPVSSIPEFLERAAKAVETALPGIRPCPFGHVGDGNLHYNLSQPEGMDKQTYLASRDSLAGIVHDIVHNLNGSFSAEHGVGLLKLPDMARYKSEVERDLMRRMKAALDPSSLFNPGKVVG